MSNKLKQLFKEILDKNESLSLDSKEDKNKLINQLTEAFYIGDWDDLQVVTELLFPDREINEDNKTQLIINTGIYNGGPCGEEPLLVDSLPASSPEILLLSEETTETEILLYATGVDLIKEDS